MVRLGKLHEKSRKSGNPYSQVLPAVRVELCIPQVVSGEVIRLQLQSAHGKIGMDQSRHGFCLRFDPRFQPQIDRQRRTEGFVIQ